MKLNWSLHPQQINVQRALSAAYQYELINYTDGRAELSVQHRGDSPSAPPIKRFVYKNRNAAFGGAQRFENQHGYRDPANHAPAEVVPFLPELPERIRYALRFEQENAQAMAAIEHHDASATYDEYREACAAVLCCVAYDCYARTEIDTPLCTTHGEAKTKTED